MPRGLELREVEERSRERMLVAFERLVAASGVEGVDFREPATKPGISTSVALKIQAIVESGDVLVALHDEVSR